MNRFCLGRRRYLYGSFFFFTKEAVYDATEDPPELVPKTGFERVYKAFSDEGIGKPSKAMLSVIQLAGASFTFGFAIGGIKRGNNAYSRFIVANQHTKFVTPYEAKRKLQDTVTLNFLQGGIFWGFKAALFTAVYSFCVIAIPIYRNTPEGVLEYVIGGALAGGLSRLHLGVKATVATAILVASVAGVIGTCAYLSSTPMSEIREMQYSWYEWRRNAMRKAREKDSQAFSKFGLTDILTMRDRRLKEKDTSGYSTSETVFIVMPGTDESSESTEPAENTAENEESNEQVNTPPIAAIVQETANTKK